MSEMAHDEKVKEVSVADGYVYIDLLCGLRLSAPIVPLPEHAAGAAPVAEAPQQGAQRPSMPLH